MRFVNQIRLKLMIFAMTGMLLVFLFEFLGGIYIGLIFIIVPIMFIFPVAYLGGLTCPFCGDCLVGSTSGGRDVNPYFKIVLGGYCSSCKEKI